MNLLLLFYSHFTMCNQTGPDTIGPASQHARHSAVRARADVVQDGLLARKLDFDVGDVSALPSSVPIDDAQLNTANRTDPSAQVK